MKTKIIDRYIATPIGIAKYNEKSRRYKVFYYGNRMNYHRALYLKNMKSSERKKIKNLEIHHIDGDRFNNQLNNLCLLTKEEHKRIHSVIPKTEYKIRIIENTKNDAKNQMKRRYCK